MKIPILPCQVHEEDNAAKLAEICFQNVADALKILHDECVQMVRMGVFRECPSWRAIRCNPFSGRNEVEFAGGGTVAAVIFDTAEVI